jgi:F0F1-type ATP synthase membrane subunit a
MFSKNKKINYWAKKVDKIVTTLIIWSAIASIFWLSQTKKWKEVSKEISDSIREKISPWVNNTSKKAISIFWKTIAFLVWIFSKK